jgi:hypothetical protein
MLCDPNAFRVSTSLLATAPLHRKGVIPATILVKEQKLRFLVALRYFRASGQPHCVRAEVSKPVAAATHNKDDRRKATISIFGLSTMILADALPHHSMIIGQYDSVGSGHPVASLSRRTGTLERHHRSVII